jgi:4-hydroxybenzoate polyprenyltransferase
MLGAYLINNYFDWHKDKLNKKPNRPLLLKKPTAIIYIFLNFLALVLGYLHSPEWSIFIFLCSLLLFGYAKYFTNWPLLGNFIVAGLSTMVVVVFYFVGEYYGWFMSQVYVLAILIFNISLIREIIKDMEDIKGDQIEGSSTLPIILGIRMSKVIVIIIQIATCFFLVSWALYYYAYLSFPFLLFFGVSFLGFVMIIYMLTSKAKNKFKNLSFYYKLYMFLGLSVIPFLC